MEPVFMETTLGQILGRIISAAILVGIIYFVYRWARKKKNSGNQSHEKK